MRDVEGERYQAALKGFEAAFADGFRRGLEELAGSSERQDADPSAPFLPIAVPARAVLEDDWGPQLNRFREAGKTAALATRGEVTVRLEPLRGKAARNTEREAQYLWTVRVENNDGRFALKRSHAYVGAALSFALGVLAASLLITRSTSLDTPYVPLAERHSIAEKIRALGWGAGAVQYPESMSLNSAEVVEFNVAPFTSAHDLSTRLNFRAEPHMKFDATGSIQVSERMQATLEGGAFEVRPLTPVEQLTLPKHVTSWKWEVRPKDYGKHKLHLTVAAFVDRGTGEVPYPLHTYSREVNVSVTMADVARFTGNNWQWFFGTLLLPACGYLWTKRRRPAAVP